MEKGTTVGVDENTSQLPDEFELAQNYPNPFNPETSIRFRVPQKTHLTLTIFNILGQKIRTLLDRQIDGGSHTIRWNGKDDKGLPVSSGIYLYRIETESFSQVRKMSLIR